MSNSAEIRHALSRTCKGRNGECTRPGGGRHTTVQGSATKGTAKYPRELCRAVLRGLTAQLKADRRLIEGCYGLQVKASEKDSEAESDEDVAAEKQLFGPAQGYSWQVS